MIIYMNLYNFKYSYVAKNDEKLKNLFQRLFLIHSKELLRRISMVECLYLNVS
jgi:hypothetical protein